MTPWSTFLSLVACGSVTAQYEVARTAATADPGPAPADFAPDAEILLSGPLLDAVVSEAVVGRRLAGALDLGVVSVEPTLEVRRLGVVPAEDPAALGLDLRMEGDLTARTLLGTTSTPIAIEATIDAALGVDRGADGAWRVTARPSAVRHLDLEVPGVARGGVASWVRDGLVGALPAVVLADPGRGGLPVRGLRAHAEGDGVRVDLRSAAPDPVPLRAPGSMPDDGFRVTVSTRSLVQVAAAMAFAEGPVAHGIVVEPTSLDVVPGDGDGLPLFLGLTLWRPVGGGWWRTYEVEGRLRLDPGGVSILPDRVEEVGHSRSAAVADPVVALAQGSLERAIERALTVSWSGSTGSRLGSAHAVVRLLDLSAPDGAVRADGALDLIR